MNDDRSQLIEILRCELSQEVSPAVAAFAETLRRRYGSSVLAVLFYGSCLRRPETQLGDSLLDFYLIVDDYRQAYQSGLLAIANQILPPNVFYSEMPWGGGTLRCKFAVMSLSHFQQGVGRKARNVSIWARFCQPVRVVWQRDDSALDAMVEACAEAVLTMLSNTVPLLSSNVPVAAIWERAFQETYQAELRTEGTDRSRELVEVDRARYEALTPAALRILSREGSLMSADSIRRRWSQARVLGKFLNVARLTKAAFTFEGGLDYILWKVRRHSGVTIEVTDWQRRHPLLAAPWLTWRLYRRGAFR